MADSQMDPGKQLILYILFQATKHLTVSDVLQVFLSSFGNKLVL
jgi:hypothetical protein